MTLAHNSHSDLGPGSPLAFARAYQSYRQRASHLTFDDTRLLLAARFWTEHQSAFDCSSLLSFWLEDLPQLIDQLPSVDLDDLHPVELEEIGVFLDDIDCRGVLLSPGSLEASSRLIWDQSARKWFYVGKIEQALKCLEQMGMGSVSLAASDAPRGAIGPEEIDGIADRADSENQAVATWMRRFASEWRDTLDSGYPNRARCLLVERDGKGGEPRGRLTDIEARIEPIEGANSDEIVIDHQVRKADDPQMESYATVLSVHRSQLTASARQPRHAHFSGRYTIKRGSGQLVSGGSTGLAAYAVTYGAWRNRELHRDRQIIGRSVAITGVVASNGSVSEVAPETLQYKIERVFHSAITHIAIPIGNQEQAGAIVSQLHAMYPKRRVHLIPVATVADLLDDRNIIRPERLCLGEFAVKQVGRWGRRPLLQLPLLVALIYLLACVLYPKAWILFDRRPSYVSALPSGFEVLNADSTSLWSIDFGDDCPTSEVFWDIGDLRGDSDPEIAVEPNCPNDCPNRSMVLVYDIRGNELFRRPTLIANKLPKDQDSTISALGGWLRIVQLVDQSILVSLGHTQYPARANIQIWDSSGARLGWYENRGFVRGIEIQPGASLAGELYLIGVNNPTNAAALFTLPIVGSRGISPPYSESLPRDELDAKGNQSTYCIIRPSDVCIESGYLYNASAGIELAAGGTVHLTTTETFEENTSTQAELDYFFSDNFQTVSIGLADTYMAHRKSLANKGALQSRPVAELIARLSDGILCWDDSVWASSCSLAP